MYSKERLQGNKVETSMQIIEAAILPIAILALAMSLLTQWVDYLRTNRKQTTRQSFDSAPQGKGTPKTRDMRQRPTP